MVNGISRIKPPQGMKIAITGNKKAGFKFTLENLQNKKPEQAHKIENDKGVEKARTNKVEPKRIDSEKLIENIFNNIDSGHKKIEGILKISMSGIKLSQQELLTLQMRVYRFTQEVELISKIVEKGTSGVKQVASTQI